MLKAAFAALLGLSLAGRGQAQSPDSQADQQAVGAALNRYCVVCHNAQLRTAGVVLDPTTVGQAGANAELWERVVRQVRSRAMPPSPMPRPDNATYDKIGSFLETSLDRAAAAHPDPGALPHLHRLTRTEYRFAVRDLLGLDDLPKEMDYEQLLPADNVASGFDNLADLLFVSPVVMRSYLDAASKIGRLAVGDVKMPVMVNLFTLPFQTSQDMPHEELQPGTRGGLAIRMYFPLDAEYEFHVEALQPPIRNSDGSGLTEPSASARSQHQLEISVDGERVKVVTVGGGGRGSTPPLDVRIPVKAGPRLVAATFIERTEAMEESTLRPPMRIRGNLLAVGSVTIRGPYNPSGPGDTPSRQRIFVCHPENGADELSCAKRILSNLARRAYRRPSIDTDLSDLLPFYQAGRAEAGFDMGIQRALERLFLSPQFLYRIERDPPNLASGASYRISDLELASRLSFFLWSSIPDDELLDLAARGRLHEPSVLEQQTKRMLADARSEALVNNFAAQWLFLRDVEGKDPDVISFRDFDGTLRKAFERETELFLDSILREGRSLTELLTANYTFVNERLAKHYGIPNINGSYFRRVTLPEGSSRGGLLGQGSILTLTSYPTRTSPVLRGKYVLENLLASPPPPPPPNVPALKTEGANEGETLSMREAMVRHRANPACAGCHARMDPIGFALENFDAVGRWRERDSGAPIDASGVLPDGAKINGVGELKKALVRDPQPFVTAVATKLMMYAVGRNMQYYDAPAIRAVVRKAAGSQYTLSSLVLGIVESVPFQMREKKP
jgi:mono/diheme cytochrome c family protein